MNFFNKHKDIIIATLLFLAVSTAYFFPIIKGYTLKMSDVKNWEGMAKESKDFNKNYDGNALWTNTSFSGMPTYQILHSYVNPLKNIYSVLIGFLSLPIMALLTAFLSFYILARSFNAGFYIALIGAFAYGLTTYNFLILEAGHVTKLMAIAYIPGVIGGMVMLYREDKWIKGFSLLTLFLALELLVNHIQMTYYFAFFMIAFGISEFVSYAKEKKYKKFILRTVLVIAAVIIGMLANFANYYNTYEFAKKTTRGKPVISIAADGKTEATANQSAGLDRDYIVQWCYGKSETWNLIIPTAKGDRTVTEKMFEELKSNPEMYNYVVENYQKNQGKLFGAYWGDQPFSSGPNYMGAIVVFLALLYLIFVQTPLKWSLLGMSILIILLSWGKNLGGSVESMWLTNFFIDYIPLYSKFRTVSSILVVLNLAVPLMAILFLTHLSNNLDWAKKNFKNISIAGGVIILVILATTQLDIIGFSSEFENAKINELSVNYQRDHNGLNPNDVIYEIESLRKDIFSADAWRSVLLIMLSFGLVLLFIKKKNFDKIAFGGIALLVLFDMWSVDKRYLNNDKNPNQKQSYLSWEKKSDFANTYDATPGDLAIYQIESANNPLIEQEKSKLLNTLSNKEKRNRKNQESSMFAALNINTNYKVMDLDNPFNSARASYFHKNSGGYSPAKLKRYQDVIDFYVSKELGFLSTGELGKMKVLNMLNNKYYLYQGQLFTDNVYAYGNAWFVNDVKWVESNNDEILAIGTSDVKNTAIIHSEFKTNINDISVKDPNASIQMLNYSPMEISYASNSSKDGLAVFSEIYYEDGWNAYIDDKKVAYARANYILRAINIPKGKHTVNFKFEPRMYTVGNAVNLIGFIIILALIVFTTYLSLKKTDNKKLQE
jgi:hypothetical protein